MFNLKTLGTAKMTQKDCQAAGIPLTDNQGRELVFHSLRHTLRTELIEAGTSEAVVNAIMRHKSQDVGNKHYGHVSGFQIRAAIEQLEYPWPAKTQAAKALA